MPARYRTIGPETSEKVAAALCLERNRRGWSREKLSREMAASGDEMSAATIQHIEAGVREGGGSSYQRLVTIDEIHALVRVLGVSFARTVTEIITEGTSETDE